MPSVRIAGPRGRQKDRGRGRKRGAVDVERGRLPEINRRSVLLFLVLMVLLLGPWRGLGRPFAAAFSAYANGVTRVMGVGDVAEQQFSPGESVRSPDHSVDDWTVWLSRRGLGAGVSPKAALDTRILGYTPLAILLALTFATAVPARRKIRVLLLGLGLVLARLAVAVLMPVGSAGAAIWLVLIGPPVMSYATPLLAWWIGLAVTTPRPADVQSAPAPRSEAAA